jgi:peptidoglycan/xylan/chitin deacetylase (PgdA/CDA1 family)
MIERRASDMRPNNDPGLPERRRLHLLYHELREHKSEYSYIVTTQQFADHLALLCDDESGLRPEFTFDDGHVSDFRYALPLLAAQGAKATFFVTTGWTGTRAGYMDWSELRALHEAGHSIGAHGWSHALLPRCNDAELDKELRGARLFLEEKLGTEIVTMSFPGGRYDKRVLKACHQAGYTRLYTSEPRPHLLGDVVGRVNIRGSMSDAYLGKLFNLRSGTLKSLRTQYILKSSLQRVLGDGLYASLWARLNRKEPDVDAVSKA